MCRSFSDCARPRTPWSISSSAARHAQAHPGAKIGEATDRLTRLCPPRRSVGPKTRQVAGHLDLGDLVRGAERLLGKLQIEQAPLIGQQLDAALSEDSPEVHG